MTRNPSSSEAATALQDRLSALSPFARYLLVFVAGFLICLVLLGWVLFPVRWTQTYPNDLQADVQNDYLSLVADSYNLTGDLDQAVKRLEHWEALDLMQMANRYAGQLQADGKVQEAGRLNALVEDTSIFRFSQEPQTGAAPAGQVESQTGSLSPSTRRLLLYLLIGILALAVLALLMRLLHIPILGAAHKDAGMEPDEIEGEALPVTTIPAASPVAPASPPVSAPAAAAPYLSDDEEEDLLEDDQVDDAEWSQEEEDAFPQPAPAAAAVAGVAAATRRSPAYEILRFDGDSTYNDIRDISDRGEYTGEFGMASGHQDADTLGGVYTLEVWLFDKSDIHTVTAVLMHPDSYADENRRQQFAGNYQAIPLQPGAPIHLQTRALELQGRVRRVEFGPAGGKGPTVRQLELELAGRRI